MKTKLILLATLAGLLIAGCRNAEMEKQNSDLQARNTQLTQELSSRDGYIDTITQSINEVFKNLQGVQTSENLLVNETNAMESAHKLNSSEIRQKLLSRISDIDSTLKGNKKRINDLQKKVNSYRTQFAGLQNMVATLKQTVEERERTIADLQTKVSGLETQLTEKDKMLTQRDSIVRDQTTTIDNQRRRINTAYYVIGSRRELERKGIIKNTGGFLWGLFGSTTVLNSGFNKEYFTPIDRTLGTTIEVEGSIHEMVPVRDTRFYSIKELGKNSSGLTIVQPQDFWQDSYLVIIAD